MRRWEATLELHMRAHGIEYLTQVMLPETHRKWRYDFIVGDRLIVEVHGGVWVYGRHTRGKGFTADREKMNEACICGYAVLEFTTDQVSSGYAIDAIKRYLDKWS